ncbi:MAG: UDP-2,4-diacetamido-2,4,6-trideoxy-beta-L-altropyranose hydrolase [Kiritimatiellae bacterium]|nr:UDP-2,4-diacetamido-2,4,6-trideoxy-beta-L-altropyranose hydrolase [Kiritimatiellia bacterium]
MRVLFRCDANSTMGFGHASRCLAWAEALRDEHVDVLFLGSFSDVARARIEEAGFHTIASGGEVNHRGDLEQLIEIVRSRAVEFVIADSYRLDDRYLSCVRMAGIRMGVIDDFHALTNYDCSLILNFTVGAASFDYPQHVPIRLLGPEYFLCRRALSHNRAQSLRRSRDGEVRNLLVAIAGEDMNSLSLRVINTLAKLRTDLCVRVVLGSTHVGTERIDQQLRLFASGSECLSSVPSLAGLLEWADACIAGGGLIKYESAFMGVPVAVLSQNAGQAMETVNFVREGLAYDLGLATHLNDCALQQGLAAFLGDTSLRSRLSARGLQVFPSHPSQRAARAVTHFLQV